MTLLSPADPDMPAPLLAEDEPPVFEVVNAGGRGAVVLTCDHASNRMPARLGSLGLGAADIASHIAWDPGAAWVARRLSVLLDAPLVLSGYSRLVVDCNRPRGVPGSIPKTSAGVPVPGNQDLTEAERAQRFDTLVVPYQTAIGHLLDARAAARVSTVLLAIHSFTPDFPGQQRPWPIALAYRHDGGLARPLVDRLRQDPAARPVGDNQPYFIGDDSDYTIPVQAERRGLSNVLVEIRQDGLGREADADRWAECLAAAVSPLLPGLARIPTPSETPTP
ncbi:putative N-formylglutamate amidohydrolase [Inquilinus ginsengisoli]|uniref:N-formylglutamate amidohydrolase n=1 Tax=Inquilinus ginsengisoli TaxID=363840 RepID=A0ABU1JNH9_9PROT|nr:N-formylglutamate amidohydrolase [Inquilinus ginsengisoli]MDR6289574.1 putative N-formylglutamate amidohydrolase [Inquilinus ginsengisoli]